MKYKYYTLHNYRDIPQIERLNKEEKFAIDVVGRVLPFKVNNYVIDELINWDDFRKDPLYVLNFPQRDMLRDVHFNRIADLIRREAPAHQVNEAVNRIWLELNPHPAGQVERNVPKMNGRCLQGVQHKYRETLVYFPSQGQTCHAYCTFCFRWPQLVGMNHIKFAAREPKATIEYLKYHPEVTDILITGGDSLSMSAGILKKHIHAFLEPQLQHIRTIRFGSRVLSYWPHRFLTDKDSEELLGLFKRIKKAGKHVAFMASFIHPNELKTDAMRQAIEKIIDTGVQIRTQAPILRHVNDHWKTWAELWRKQVNFGCVPYYMFVVRDTGAQHYFAIPLVKSWRIFKEAYQNVSGVCRTVRGPSMSADPGKVQVLGPAVLRGEKVLTLQFLQARDPDWVMRPFFAEYDEKAIWLNDLNPAFGEKRFFFEKARQPHFPLREELKVLNFLR